MSNNTEHGSVCEQNRTTAIEKQLEVANYCYINLTVNRFDLDKLDQFEVKVEQLEKEDAEKVLGEVARKFRAFAAYVNDDTFTEYLEDMLLPIMAKKAKKDPIEAIRFGVSSVFLAHHSTIYQVLGKTVLDKLAKIFNF